MAQFLTGRCPIFDEGLHVRGYQLCSWDADTHLPAALPATGLLRVVGHSVPYETVLGGKFALVKGDASRLAEDLPPGLLPSGSVLEIAPCGEDAARIDACQRLVAAGYRLAFDDRRLAEWPPAVTELASVVTFQTSGVSLDEMAHRVRRCRARGVQLWAEGVETPGTLYQLRTLGFDHFVGHLLSRATGRNGVLSPIQVNCLRLLTKLCDEDVAADEVAALIEKEPALSHAILRAATRGPIGGFARGLHSVQQGVVLLGSRRLRNWATVMLLSNSHFGADEQLNLAMIRARMAELLAGSIYPAWEDAGFIVGLCSSLELLLNVPLETIVAHLPMSPELVAALIGHEGELGAILERVLSWELGEGIAAATDLSTMQRTYLDALNWTFDICRECWDCHQEVALGCRPWGAEGGHRGSIRRITGSEGCETPSCAIESAAAALTRAADPFHGID